MRKEFWLFFGSAIFFLIVAPTYWAVTNEITGTVALVMTLLLCSMISFYLWFVAKAIPARPEDRSDGEIADGAGELGFFPPYSWWPLFCALALVVIVLGVIFGWWLFAFGLVLGAICVVGWIYEYYRGIYAH